MEVFVSAPSCSFSNWKFPDDSAVRDLLDRFTQDQLSCPGDLYVVSNGRRLVLEDLLQNGSVYQLRPRLVGGKGGFGSMLRALGAQIEKTTNREACRDLSGRRLRDVNHEKEMAEWLKKQAEREAEKEQRRLERLQRKLAEPKHQFTDQQYQQQCHELSERLEDSVIKGLQASSSGLVKVDDVSATKRPNSDQSEQPHAKKKKNKTAVAAACFWTGVDELPSSEDEDEEEESPCSSSSGGAAAVTMTTWAEEAEPEQSGSSSSQDQRAPEPLKDPTIRPSEDQRAPEPPRDPTIRPSEDQRAPEPPRDPTIRPSEDQRAPEACKPAESSSLSQQQQQQQQQKGGQSLLDLASVSSVDQLESLGLGVLKEELMFRGLKCGGTLTERAARLFSIRGLTPDQIDPALLARPGKRK